MPRFLIVIALVTAVLSAAAAAREGHGAGKPGFQEIKSAGQTPDGPADEEGRRGAGGAFRRRCGVRRNVMGEIFSGREKIRDYYSKTIPALGDNFTRESTADEVHALGNYAWALGHGRTVIRTQEGVADLKDHWVAVYEMVGHEWKVRALSGKTSHSCPPDFEEGGEPVRPLNIFTL